MENKGYTDIIEVYETIYYEEANKYLKLGWVIIDTYKTCFDPHPPYCNEQDMHYVLGWLSSKGKIIKPKEDLRPFPITR